MNPFKIGNAPKTQEDWNALRFEAGQLFTPSSPIAEHDLFAGRGAQIRTLIEATEERGKHAVLYGEAGVGKTSLAKVYAELFPSTFRYLQSFRVQVDPSDDFSSVWRKVFKDIHVRVIREGSGNSESDTAALASFYEGQTISPDDVRRELDAIFKPAQIPIIVIDEFDKIRDPNAHTLMANTIKSLSDYGVNATIVLVGVAENISSLIGEHPSVMRCLEQVHMPRMNATERKEILDKRIPKLGMKLHQDALWKIVELSRGLPSYVHLLGLYSTQSAIERKSLLITETDVDNAISRVLLRLQESLSEKYHTATHSNRGDNLYQEVLLACALAESDDRGSFTPMSIAKQLTKILGREREMPTSAFQQHLIKFVSSGRGSVLTRTGRERAYR
ncbi:MAG: ATP-binding protein, partial [Rhizobiales bacterium]|nr:ATP-binding protein [Hyphomicrobiales bacterium]